MRENTLVPTPCFASGSQLIPSMSPDEINGVAGLERQALTVPQLAIQTQHILHGGIYTRTVRIPADVLIIGALIVRPTILTLSGDCLMYAGGEPQRVTGYAVMPASANRKNVFWAITETMLSLSFKTDALTVEQAEAELTPETEKLLSRHGSAHNIYCVTGV